MRVISSMHLCVRACLLLLHQCCFHTLTAGCCPESSRSDGSSFITRYVFTFTPPVANQPINFDIRNPFIVTNNLTVNSLRPCTRYTLSVVAVNAAGTSQPASGSISTLCQPTPRRTFSLLTGGNVSSTARTRPAIFWR